jgi:hypothetical protein
MRPLFRRATRSALLLVPLLVPLVGPIGCGGGGGQAAGFTVVDTRPLPGSLGVALGAEVRVVFSDLIDASTIGATALRVVALGIGAAEGTVDQPPDGQGRTLRWRGQALLAPNTAYEFRVSSSLASTSGEMVSGRLEFPFRTIDPPEVPFPTRANLREVGSLLRGRRSHTGTLLADGRVLVTGGITQATVVTSRAELYDPVIERFSNTSSLMESPRAAHTATRLADGRVLLAGGWYEAAPGQLLITATAEVYDPGTDTFLPVGSMNVERVDHAAIRLPSGEVLITGGSRLVAGVLQDLDSAERFDPTTNTFTLHPATLAMTRATHGMVADGRGRVVLAGGNAGDVRAERFDIASGAFTALPPAFDDLPRFGPQVASFASGGVCVAGGERRGAVTYVHPDAGALNTGSPLCVPRAYGTATRYGPDRVLVVGGMDPNLFLHSTADVVIESGLDSGSFCTDIVFPTPMVLHTATVLADGTVLYCGGLNPTGGLPELFGAYLFTPP